MYIIVGLGNPGREYEKTRHNTGFMVLDELSKKYNIDISKEKHKALIGAGTIEGEKIILVKPQTFMNLSGESVQEIMNFYKEDINNLIVIFDDIDLPVGTIRIKQNGSAGTHNGVKSIVKELNSKEFKRIKVGIGGPNENMDLISHVLGKFSNEEITKIDESMTNAAEAVVDIIKSGVLKAMNKYN